MGAVLSWTIIVLLASALLGAMLQSAITIILASSILLVIILLVSKIAFVAMLMCAS